MNTEFEILTIKTRIYKNEGALTRTQAIWERRFYIT